MVTATIQVVLQPGMLKGFYNEHSATQASTVHHCKGLLMEAAETVPLLSGTICNVGEWGCAHGGNSISPVYTICESLSRRLSNSDQKLQVHVTHTDVKGNSWQELFACAQQYQNKVHANLDDIQITYAGIGSSQYVRNLPNSTLDLGFSFNSVHWLRAWPCRLQHAMSPFSHRALPEELAALTAQAREDLHLFLTLRADEFKPRGMLIMSYGIMDEQDTSWRNLFEVPQAVAEQMVAEGLLKDRELGALASPVFFLNEATQKQVFSEVSDKWELLHFDVGMATNPQAEQLQKEGSFAKANGQMVSDFIRAAMWPFMEAGLKAEGRDQDAANSLLDTFFRRLAERAANPNVHLGYPTTQVLLRRRG